MPEGPTPSTPEVTPTPATPAPTPAQSQLEREVGGDWTKAEKRIHDQNHYIKTLESAIAKVPAPVAAAPSGPSPLEQFANDLAVDPRQLETIVRTLAREEADSRFRVVEQTLQARSNVMREFPTFASEEAAFQNFLSENPAINEKVTRIYNSGLADEALEFGYRAFKAANPPPLTPDPAGLAGAALPPVNGAAGRPDPKAAEAAQTNADGFLDKLKYAHRTHDTRPALEHIFAGSKPRGWNPGT